MPVPAPRFSADTLKFLRALKRHNRRDWFNARRDQHETVVRQPMAAIIQQLAIDFSDLGGFRRIIPRRST